MKSEKECATCKNWIPGRTSAEVRALRMALCRLGPVWEYLPPHSTCNRYVPAAPKAVAARLAWLGARAE